MKDNFNNEELDNNAPLFFDKQSNTDTNPLAKADNLDDPKVKASNIVRRKAILTTKKIAIIAVLSAMSYVLYMFVKFPMPFLFPQFLEVQFSELPALIGGFALGPISGSIIILVRFLLKLPFSMTAGVGELADLLLGLAIVLPSSIIYKKHKTKKSALIGILIGMSMCVVIAVIVNRFLVIPFYVQSMFKGNWAPLIGMVQQLFPSITQNNFYSYYIPLAVVPFNILRCILSGGLTFVVYKKTSQLIKIITADNAKRSSGVCTKDKSK